MEWHSTFHINSKCPRTASSDIYISKSSTKLNCVRGEHRPACGCLSAAVTLTLNPTLKLDHDLDILKAHHHTENKVHRSSQVVSETEKNENSSQGQRSNITNFEPLLAFTVRHIPSKLHQFPTSSFWDFVRTDAQTDRRGQKQYLLTAQLVHRRSHWNSWK